MEESTEIRQLKDSLLTYQQRCEMYETRIVDAAARWREYLAAAIAWAEDGTKENTEALVVARALMDEAVGDASKPIRLH